MQATCRHSQMNTLVMRAHFLARLQVQLHEEVPRVLFCLLASVKDPVHQLQVEAHRENSLELSLLPG